MNARTSVVGLLLFLVFLLSSGLALAWVSMPGKAGVTAFACSDDEQKMVVGTYYGGVWFSLNGGVTWYPSDTGENRIDQVYSIEAVDSEADTLFMRCTASAYPNYQNIQKSTMISTNNGQTWIWTTGNHQNYYDDTMIIDSNDHNHIYCLNRQRFIKSEDFGETWGEITNVDMYNSLTWMFMQDTQSDSTLFISGIYGNYEASGIYRSDDLGVTWNAMLDPVLYYQSYVRPGGEVYITDIDRLSNGHLFATVNTAYNADYYPYSIDSFLRSLDDGQTWHEEYPLHEMFDPLQIMEVQDDPGHLYLFSERDYPFYYHKLYESKDYGLSFHPVPAPYFNEFRDCASMSQNPFSGFEYVCTTGNGTWKSEDNGDTWQELQQPPFSTVGYQHIDEDFVSYVNRGGNCVYLQRNSDPEVLEIHYPNPSVDYAQANLPIVSVRGDTIVGMYYREVYETETHILFTAESPDLGETWGEPITIIPMEQIGHNLRPVYSQSEGYKYISVASYNDELGFVYLLNDRGEYLDTYTYNNIFGNVSIAEGYLYLFDSDAVKRIPLGGNQWEDLNYPYYQEGSGTPGLVSEEFEEIYTFGGIHGYRYLNDQWQMLSVVPYGGIQSVAAIPRHGQEPILLLTTRYSPEVFISTDGGWEWDPIPNEAPWFEHSARNGEVIYDPWRECIWVETPHGLVWEGEEWFDDVAEQKASRPESFGLMHAWPNPFNASTTVTIRLSRPGEVKLTLYNALGQELRTVADSRLTVGEHQVTVDASDFASGTYFLRLVTPEGASVRKLVLLR